MTYQWEGGHRGDDHDYIAVFIVGSADGPVDLSSYLDFNFIDDPTSDSGSLTLTLSPEDYARSEKGKESDQGLHSLVTIR